MQGTVKGYSKFYGYGFILGPDKRDYFCHWSFISMPGYKYLIPGQVVTFDPHQTYRGWQARNVRIIRGRREPEERVLKENPFTPQDPIRDPAKFAGRREPLINAIDALYNRKNVLVTGERSVGKSSLAFQLAYLTEGEPYLLKELRVDIGDSEFAYFVTDHRCFPGHTIEDVIAGLLSNMQNKLAAIQEQTGEKIIHEIDLKFYKARREEEYRTTVPPELISKFATDIEQSWLYLVDAGCNGLCVLIDELDWLGTDVPIAFFLKSVIEKLHMDGYLDVCFIVTGVTSYVAEMFKQHPSVLRLFENIRILPMSDAECAEIIDRALKGTSVSIQESAKSRIVSLAAGFPAPVHQLGYHSYRFDQDNRIDRDDLDRALLYVIGQLRHEEFTAQHQKLSLGPEEELIRIIARAPGEEVDMEYLLQNVGAGRNMIYGILGGLLEKGYVVRPKRGKFRIREPLFRLYLRWKEGIL